jgi:hypothetical protein
MRLDPVALIGTGSGRAPILPFAYATARSYDIAFLPVAWVGESKAEHIRSVAEAAEEDGRGAALRFRLHSVVPRPGQTQEAMIEKMCADLGCEPSSCDLLLDLGFLEPYYDHDPRLTANSINALAAVGPWRSVVLLGSSIPATLHSIDEGTVGGLLRLEWDLWTQILSCEVSRTPVFGDHVVQGPCPPAEGGWRNMRATVRYTAGNKTLVARGTGPIREAGWGQYRELCQQIVELEEFAGPDYTYGDRLIDECARGIREPGSQVMWREAGTSHHLRCVTDQVRAQQAGALPRVAGGAAFGTRRGE